VKRSMCALSMFLLGCPGGPSEPAKTEGAEVEAKTSTAEPGGWTLALSAPQDGERTTESFLAVEGTLQAEAETRLLVVVRWLPPSGVEEDWPAARRPVEEPSDAPAVVVVGREEVDPTRPPRLAAPLELRLRADGLVLCRGQTYSPSSDPGHYSLSEFLEIEAAGYEREPFDPDTGRQGASMLPVRLVVEEGAGLEPLAQALSACVRNAIPRTEVLLTTTATPGERFRVQVPLMKGDNAIRVRPAGEPPGDWPRLVVERE
jgi:hypothetical protein